MGKYRARGYRISIIRCDGEGAISALRTEIENSSIVLDVPGAGQIWAANTTSRSYDQSNQRGILSSLLFYLPKSWLVYLIYFVTSRINLKPKSNSSRNVSPKEEFTGKKPRWKREVQCGFRETVECVDSTANNDLRERTITGVALYPVGDDLEPCELSNPITSTPFPSPTCT